MFSWRVFAFRQTRRLLQGYVSLLLAPVKGFVMWPRHFWLFGRKKILSCSDFAIFRYLFVFIAKKGQPPKPNTINFRYICINVY